MTLLLISKKNMGIFIVIMVVLGGGIVTSLYNYILLNQLEFVISGTFVFPYSAANDDRTHPLAYTSAKPLTKEWIVNIQNTLSYALRPDAKVVIKIQEPAPSDRFIEIVMYGDKAFNRFSATISKNKAGYMVLYDKNGVDGWSIMQPIVIAYDNDQYLSINLGPKVLVDRLPLTNFALGSIVVYGKDDTYSPLNAYAGHISFEALSGRSAYSTIFLLPLVILAGFGSVMIVLLMSRKRSERH